MEHQIQSTLSANTPPVSASSTNQDDAGKSCAELTAQFSGLAVKPVALSSVGNGYLAANEPGGFPEGSDINAKDLEKREIKAEFKPFPSIEDCKNQSYIDEIFAREPGLSEALYVVSEKLDGANFNVMISADSIRYFSRNQEVRAEKPFFDAPMTFKKYLGDFKKIQSALKAIGCESLTLRGEYFGSDINRRISYGEKKFSPFIIEMDGKPQTHQRFLGFMKDMEFDLLEPVPLLRSDLSFTEALAFDPENIVTRASTNTEAPASQAAAAAPPTVHDFIEGIVIQPCDFLIKGGSRPFLLKKRAEQYLEIEKKGDRIGKFNLKIAKPNKSDRKTDNYSFPGFIEYVTENRMINVISKLGELSSQGKLGFYIKEMIQDAKTDYCKDNPEATMEDRLPPEVNQVARNKIVDILKSRYPEFFQKKGGKSK
ncbi:RNA ligase family protein [Endozoicomonas sp. SCSIO W0465]|uniref:RNA ligase family protein n=1 Tax=Endozoicomonas sp. SCSIO W0465 TaxID=2918516 RepID=UPI002074BE36|nr:RNA ligase family protein [Endozoicomonas sp. SCSIO W0465]USE33812.1 hypothetical protein MJO57_16680 [Endozoicomonas sp. SCSIO W0465]